MSDFENKTLDELVEQTTYLEIAGANAEGIKSTSETIAEVSTMGSRGSNIESKLDRLVDLMEQTLTCEEQTSGDQLNYAGRGDRETNRRGRNWNQRTRNNARQGGPQKKCRICNDSTHLFRKCPERFCQTCGGKGHDGWDRDCPKYK